MAHRQQWDYGSLLIEIGVLDRIYATLTINGAAGETRKTSAISGRIVCIDPVCIELIVVTWTSKEMLIYIGKEVAGSSVSPALYFGQVYTARERVVQESDVVDYSEKNAKALTRRSGRLVGRLKPKDGTRLGGDGYMLSSLKNEISQLRGLITLIEKRDEFHISGVAGKLRLMLQRDGQFPLLQLCAAIVGCDLIVFTRATPERLPSIQPDICLLLSPISATETELLYNPVDIDVWLGFISILIGNAKLTNEKVIADLGNTIGNHLDANIPLSVDTLRNSEAGHGNQLQNALSRYVMQVATAIVALGERVIKEAQTMNLIGL